MADARSKRTGEHSSDLVRLATDAAHMRAQLAALESRVASLEAELSTARKSVAPRPSKRPAATGRLVPPPLPPGGGVVMPSGPRSAGRRSIVDISEIAELVESLPPPPRTPRK